MRDHGRIVDTIARGGAAMAERRVREHRSDTLGKVDDVRQRYPDHVKD